MSTLKPFLAEIRERLSEATPGPWRHVIHFYRDLVQFASGEYSDDDMLPANAELIAHAPADLKTLVEICEKQRDFIEILALQCQPPFDDMTKQEMDAILTTSARTCLAECDELILGNKK